MPIKVECTCGKSMVVPDKFKGKTGTCKGCGKKITVGENASTRDISSKKKERKRSTSKKRPSSSTTRPRKKRTKAKSSGTTMIVILAVLFILAGLGIYSYLNLGSNKPSNPDEIESITNNEDRERNNTEGTVPTETANEPSQTESKPVRVLGPNEFPVGIWQDGDQIFAMGRNGTFLSNSVDMSEGFWTYEGDTLEIQHALLKKSYEDLDGKIFKTGPQGGSLKEIGKAPALPDGFLLLGHWKGPNEEVNFFGSGSFSSSIPNFEKGSYRVLDSYIQLVSGSRLILSYKADGSLINLMNGKTFKQP